MINENIKYYRKRKGMSQEEMAVKLHVVRQTVSKWETGHSVPDADILIHISELLEVPVYQLLDLNEISLKEESLSKELERLNHLLAEKNKKEKIIKEAYKKRGIIITLSFLSLILALTIKNEIVSILSIAICLLLSILILYRNLALLTSLTTDDMRIRILRITTIFNVIIFLVCVILSILIGLDLIKINAENEKLLAMSIISCVILFSGIISPKLPFTKHTGLRLPWTVQDEDTWNLAHRIIGYISFPIVILYIAATFSIDNFETVTLGAMIAWIGIPGLLSLVYYFQKSTKGI
ncbi:transcriptional regulator [Faecalitalea cylindroides]|uniref:Transcriptional regulator n=1 Tax=Faecalitalea cylindroides TaxID=39483 RepID=A0A1Y4LVE0_9FIRM|nr:XRE family transcriptional regulator [Faecalitalea cylindroides]OUP60567.1 transcriptional regulator [Faecalitalea cylindroides]